MDQYVPYGIAALVAFGVWKIFAGFVRILLVAGLVGGAAYVWWFDLLDGFLK
jgi:hypothetical protein